MNSMAGHHHQAMNCSCAVSQQEDPIAPANLFELRYDLPRAQGLRMPPLTVYRPAEFIPALLDGFFVPADQPPRTLQF
jgi:hypothetical protein